MMTEIVICIVAAMPLWLFGTLVALRMNPGISRRAMTAWLKLPRMTVNAILLGLLGVSAICAGLIEMPLERISRTSVPISTDALAMLASAPSSDFQALTSSDTKDRALGKLRDYAEKISSKKQMIASLGGSSDKSESEPPLPDVETMIERLAARLKAEPNNPEGWTMLGWSLLNTGKISEAVDAYKSAQKYDQNSAAVRLALAAAEARLGENARKSDEEPVPALSTQEATPMIRGMVDRLAARLETNPNDAEGWIRLMKSRTALGETDLAKDALRRALAAFGNDQASRNKFAAAAKEFGLVPE